MINDTITKYEDQYVDNLREHGWAGFVHTFRVMVENWYGYLDPLGYTPIHTSTIQARDQEI